YWTQTFFKGIAIFKSSSEKDACFHLKDVKTGFVEIIFQRVSNKIIHFIDQTAFFDHSDMSH
ncbi:hypothetical protein BpHYR1_004428, partial [Brachionus plicatilis]